MSEPKSIGVTYLRYAVNAQKKRASSKFVSIPMKQAEEIIKQAEGFVPSQLDTYSPKQNSVKAAALILGLDVKDLIKRLEAPDIENTLNSLCEAKNRIKAYETIGDRMYERLRVLGDINNQLRKEWYDARNFL